MSSTNRHRRVSEVLEIALEAEATDRDRIIAQQCSGDDELIREVKALLEHDKTESSVLDTPLSLANIVLDQDAESIGMGGVRVPGFVLTGVLGQGMSSIVYHARQEVPDREVAIKVLRPLSCTEHAESRIRAEAHLLARLEHPSIAQIYQFGVIESKLHSQPYLVMELARGMPLPEYLEAHELSFQERLDLVFDLCEIFEYAHKQGVVHRDIKPSNIIIRFDETGKAHKPIIIDFGIAKLIHGEPIPIDIQTLHPEAFGTLRYMSPERLAGRSSGDSVASDIYSIGVLATELLGGHHSSSVRTTQSTARELNPGLSESVCRVLSRMTHPNPEQRFATVHDASMALLKAAKETSWIAKQTKAWLLFGVAVLAFAAVFVGSRANTPDEPLTLAPMREDVRKALNVINISPEMDDETKFSVLRGRFYMIGSYTASGHHASARRYIEQTERDFESVHQIPELLQVRYLRARGFYEGTTGQAEKAYATFLETKEFVSLGPELTYEEANDWKHVAHGIQTYGDHQIARQMYDELINHSYFSALSWEGRSTALGFSAGLYWLDNDLVKAEQMFRQLVESAPTPSTTKENDAVAQHLSSLGVVLMTLNRYDEAEPYMKQAADISALMHQPSDQLVCRMYRNLATNHLFQGKYASCESIMLSVHDIWSTMPELRRYELVESNFLLGSAYLGLDRPGLALQHLQDAQDNGRLLPEKRVEQLLPRIDNALGEAMCRSGSLEAGKELLLASELTIQELLVENSPWALIAAERSKRFGVGN